MGGVEEVRRVRRRRRVPGGTVEGCTGRSPVRVATEDGMTVVVGRAEDLAVLDGGARRCEGDCFYCCGPETD
ncbi:hypothetical protein AB2L28_04165 [Kineococcus sp. TBRC 1896]|uniref:Uncharacterized protein n=1 Tax=Kineococcus mangrovi TaxID=1660183 RepID=A0ABV4I058_9ACTN